MIPSEEEVISIPASVGVDRFKFGNEPKQQIVDRSAITRTYTPIEPG
jgi:hypothetical protein